MIFVNEAGSMSMGGSSHSQHCPSLHEVLQLPHTARELRVQHSTTARENRGGEGREGEWGALVSCS